MVQAQCFDQAAAQISFDHYLAARSARDAQLKAINAGIDKAATTPPLDEPVATLRCLRGITPCPQ